jgi:hypothetical protein
VIVVLNHDRRGRRGICIDHFDSDHGSCGNDRMRRHRRPAVESETETSLVCFGKVKSAWGMEDGEVSHGEQGDVGK